MILTTQDLTVIILKTTMTSCDTGSSSASLPLDPRKRSCTSSCCPVPSGKSELCVAPLLFASKIRETVPGSSQSSLLRSYILNCLFSVLIQPRLSHPIIMLFLLGDPASEEKAFYEMLSFDIVWSSSCQPLLLMINDRISIAVVSVET